jgi:hypothetical protein
MMHQHRSRDCNKSTLVALNTMYAGRFAPDCEKSSLLLEIGPAIVLGSI